MKIFIMRPGLRKVINNLIIIISFRVIVIRSILIILLIKKYVAVIRKFIIIVRRRIIVLYEIDRRLFIRKRYIFISGTIRNGRLAFNNWSLITA